MGESLSLVLSANSDVSQSFGFGTLLYDFSRPGEVSAFVSDLWLMMSGLAMNCFLKSSNQWCLRSCSRQAVAGAKFGLD